MLDQTISRHDTTQHKNRNSSHLLVACKCCSHLPCTRKILTFSPESSKPHGLFLEAPDDAQLVATLGIVAVELKQILEVAQSLVLLLLAQFLHLHSESYTVGQQT